MKKIAILAGARTPFCKAFTDLQSLSAVELGRLALLDAVRRSGMTASQVDEVIFGNVAGPPDATNLARVIALKAGVPADRIAHTVNRNCASGMESILAGCHSIRTQRSKVVVAGGTESMSNIPLLVHPEAAKIWLRLARAKSIRQRLSAFAAFRPKHFKPVVGIELGLTDPVSGLNMGETAEVLAREFALSRARQDQFALASHQKASLARQECFFSGEIVPVDVSNGAKVEKDNGPRQQQSLDQLAKLRPIFASEGTVTAGNSCSLTDGAAALVLVDGTSADQYDEQPLGYITAYAITGCEPSRMGLGPVYATAKLLKQTGWQLSDFDQIELNEAFAAQVLACQEAARSMTFAREELGRSTPLGEFVDERLNVHGGAIALGHPVGTTGTRLVLTLLRTLRASGLHRGLATLCVGGGQGVAIAVEVNDEARR